MFDMPPPAPPIKGVPVYKPHPSEDPNLPENLELIRMFEKTLAKDKAHYIEGLDNNKLSTNSVFSRTPKPVSPPKQNLPISENTVTYYVIYYRYLDSKTWNHSGLSTDAEILRKSVEAKPYVDIKSIHLKDVQLPL